MLFLLFRLVNVGIHIGAGRNSRFRRQIAYAWVCREAERSQRIFAQIPIYDLHAHEAGFIFTQMQIEKVSSTVFTPLEDGGGVLLNLDTLLYYSLNHTGAMLWQQIENKKVVALEELVRSTCERFDVEEEAAHRHLTAFLKHLESLKMVRILS
jgi:hypothetical protein